MSCRRLVQSESLVRAITLFRVVPQLLLPVVAVIALSKASSPLPLTSASTIPVSELLRHCHLQILKLSALAFESFLRGHNRSPPHRKIPSPIHSTTMSPSYLLSSSPIMAPKKVKRRRRPLLYSFWTRFDALSNEINEKEGKESKWFSYRPLPPAHPFIQPPIFL